MEQKVSTKLLRLSARAHLAVANDEGYSEDDLTREFIALAERAADEIDKLTAERDALAAALSGLLAVQGTDPDGYMEFAHHPDCGAYDGMRGYTCDCGLMKSVDVARAALAQVTAGKEE